MGLSKIKTIKLKISTNPKGDVLKYLTRKNKYFKKFGEVYFTEIKKNKVKGWNFHKKCWCLLAVPYGKVKFTFAKNINGKSENSGARYQPTLEIVAESKFRKCQKRTS